MIKVYLADERYNNLITIVAIDQGRTSCLIHRKSIQYLIVLKQMHDCANISGFWWGKTITMLCTRGMPPWYVPAPHTHGLRPGHAPMACTRAIHPWVAPRTCAHGMYPCATHPWVAPMARRCRSFRAQGHWL